MLGSTLICTGDGLSLNNAAVFLECFKIVSLKKNTEIQTYRMKETC